MAGIFSELANITVKKGSLGAAIIGLILIFMSGSVLSTGDVARQYVILIGVAIVFASISTELFTYLQSNRPPVSVDRPFREQMSRFRKGFESLREQTSTIGGLSVEERKSAIEEIKASLSDSATKQIAEQWEQKYKPASVEGEFLKSIRTLAEEMQERLQGEISALGRRANVNLVIGIGISTLGLIALTWFVIAATSEISAGLEIGNSGLRFMVRLSLAIFIQVFAYFFLRLYRYSIFEIKYFQNEITGAQFKLISLEAALLSKDKKMIEKIAADLAKTERNFILKKGETTIGLRREEMEKDFDAMLSSSFEKIARSQKTQTG